MIIFELILELLLLGFTRVFGVGKNESLNVVSLKGEKRPENR